MLAVSSLIIALFTTCPAPCACEYCELRCKSATGPQSRADCMDACWRYVNEHGCWPCQKAPKPAPDQGPKQ